MTSALTLRDIPISAEVCRARDVIFLTHRIPYPPDKGDKIRSFHLLKGLARNYRIHLGAFIDHPDDRRFKGDVAELCASTCFIDLNRFIARSRSLAGLLGREPLTFAYYRSGRLARWVNEVSEHHDIQAMIVFSGCMAQYSVPTNRLNRILDMVDVDSEKWGEYSRTVRGPNRWLYQREQRLLCQAEVHLASEFDHTVLVTRPEADLLRSRMKQGADRVVVISNGVDITYFDPEVNLPDPYQEKKGPVVVFTGAMDYRANVDGVLWFTEEVWPLIRTELPLAQFWIVGARPVSAVRSLDRQEGVFVTGRVKDIRPYLRFANVAVVPLRIARGLQNKILEAMAMELPVVGTPQAWEGIEDRPTDCGRSVEYADIMAKEVNAYLRGQRQADIQGRRFVANHYAWERVIQRFCQLIEPKPQAARST